MDLLNSIEPILKESNGLQGYDNAAINDIIQVIKSAKNGLLMQSSRINKLDDIIYRNGWSDTCDVIISMMNKRKTQTQVDQRTGQVINGMN